MAAFTAGSLLSFLATVPDPRSRHGRRHPLSAILAVVCCAIMCGAKSYAAIGQWAQDQDMTGTFSRRIIFRGQLFPQLLRCQLEELPETQIGQLQTQQLVWRLILAMAPAKAMQVPA